MEMSIILALKRIQYQIEIQKFLRIDRVNEKDRYRGNENCQSLKVMEVPKTNLQKVLLDDQDHVIDQETRKEHVQGIVKTNLDLLRMKENDQDHENVDVIDDQDREIEKDQNQEIEKDHVLNREIENVLALNQERGEDHDLKIENDQNLEKGGDQDREIEQVNGIVNEKDRVIVDRDQEISEVNIDQVGKDVDEILHPLLPKPLHHLPVRAENNNFCEIQIL